MLNFPNKIIFTLFYFILLIIIIIQIMFYALYQYNKHRDIKLKFKSLSKEI
jgi:hypothetical protein